MVSDEMRRLWRLDEVAPRGRRPRLSTDVVVAAAIEIADRDGLPAVTLPRIAESLYVTAMSLYRYIGSAAELPVLMADFVSAHPPTVHGESWRDGIERWAVAMLALYRRHVWLCDVDLSTAPSGPNSVAWMDAFLENLRDIAIPGDEKLAVMSLAGNFVRGFARVQLAMHRGSDLIEKQAQYWSDLGEVLDSDLYPNVVALLRHTAGTEPLSASAEIEEEFAFGIRIIVDGISAVIERGDTTDAGSVETRSEPTAPSLRAEKPSTR